MTKDIVTSGMCLGNFDKADASCSICLIRRQCKTETQRVAKSGGDVISRRELKADGVVDPMVEPLDIFLNKLSDSMGSPDVSQTTREGVTLTRYSFTKDGVVVAQVWQGSDSKASVIRVSGVAEKKMPARATADDYLAEAEIILSHLIS
jgi:hypothetical protein